MIQAAQAGKPMLRHLRMPIFSTGIASKPRWKAGESGWSLKSSFFQSTNIGSALRLCWSQPSACQDVHSSRSTVYANELTLKRGEHLQLRMHLRGEGGKVGIVGADDDPGVIGV